MQKPDIIKLSELQDEIREVLQGNFERPRWVVAEISDLKENLSGHCYLDLVEKDERSDNLLARARATIWASTYRMLKPFFETSTGYELAAGVKVMVSAVVEYHPVYGLSLNIKDIDPTYTMGDVERRRQETIARLEREGVLHMNRETVLPEVPQRIAVISSRTAAGYEDFLKQLQMNPYGYVFYPKLYPAVMQGEKAEGSIIQALERVFEREDFFDLVVIIRGGGSKSDLACFDSYDLAFHVSQFPIPVLTGIGHEQDDTITDMVAHTRLKTPTAVAGFLVDRLASFDARLYEYSEILVKATQSILNQRNLELQLFRQRTASITQVFVQELGEGLLLLSSRARHLVQRTMKDHFIRLIRLGENLKNGARNVSRDKRLELVHTLSRLKQLAANAMEMEKNRLLHAAASASYAEPARILKLGFSISRFRGKALKETSLLHTGDTIETELARGKISSRVTDIKKKLYIRKSKESSG